MDRQIYVDIPPQSPFLTQYTRSLLLDCLKGVKQIKHNEHVLVEDLFATNIKKNTTDKPIRIFFNIVSFDNSYPIIKKRNTNDENVTIQQLKQKTDKLEEIILEQHLDLETEWGHHVFLDVGKEIDTIGRNC
tara:strand:- start:2308 stop:2703 length:396 start_codon:yes stop_codon:yes gene_type:complete